MSLLKVPFSGKVSALGVSAAERVLRSGCLTTRTTDDEVDAVAGFTTRAPARSRPLECC